MLTLLYSFAVGWLAGKTITEGIILEFLKAATWFTRVSLFFGLVVIAHSFAGLFS